MPQTVVATSSAVPARIMDCFEAVPNGVVVLGRAIEVAEIRFAANESAGLEFAFGTPRAFVVIEVGLALAVSRDEGMRELEDIVPEGN
jgi:hypothetical protein